MEFGACSDGRRERRRAERLYKRITVAKIKTAIHGEASSHSHSHSQSKPGLRRLVSNLSFLSKLIVKCVHLQLTEHIDKNNLFPQLQSGYRKGHICETAVLKIHNDIFMAMDEKRHVILMLIDLSAAFDTINYNLLYQWRCITVAEVEYDQVQNFFQLM